MKIKNYKQNKEIIKIEPYKNLRKTNIFKPDKQIEQLEPYKTIRIERESTELLNKELKKLRTELELYSLKLEQQKGRNRK